MNTFGFNFHFKGYGQLFYGTHHPPLVANVCVCVYVWCKWLIARLIFHWPSISRKFMCSFVGHFFLYASLNHHLIWILFSLPRNNWNILFVHYHKWMGKKRQWVDFFKFYERNCNEMFISIFYLCIEGNICKHMIGFKYCCSHKCIRFRV